MHCTVVPLRDPIVLTLDNLQNRSIDVDHSRIPRSLDNHYENCPDLIMVQHVDKERLPTTEAKRNPTAAKPQAVSFVTCIGFNPWLRSVHFASRHPLYWHGKSQLHDRNFHQPNCFGVFVHRRRFDRAILAGGGL